MLLYNISGMKIKDSSKLKEHYVNDINHLTFTETNFFMKLLDKKYVILDVDVTKLPKLKDAFAKAPELFTVSFTAIDKGKVDYTKIIESGYDVEKAWEYYYGLLKNIDLKPFDESERFMHFVRTNYELLKEKKLFDKRKSFNVYKYNELIKEYNKKISDYRNLSISYDRYSSYLFTNDEKGLIESLDKLYNAYKT